MNLNPTLYKAPWARSASNNVEESYLQFLGELREDIKAGEESEYLSEEFQEELSQIIFRKELDDYQPHAYYWLNLIEGLIDTISLIEEEFEGPEELIGVFSETEYLGFVIEELEKGSEIESIISHIIDIQELQIVSFFHLQLGAESWQPDGPVNYHAIPEMGDDDETIYLGKDKLAYQLPQEVSLQSIPVIGHFPETRTLQILLDDKVIDLEPIPHSFFQREGINLIPSLGVENDFDLHKVKFEKAVIALKELCPDLLDHLKMYTQYIVRINQKELVSYSMATLPGYSSINLFDRDFVDLVDDLIHENGHHFLNALLEGEEELIFEDDDKIFFSPWRRALRPVRGLYHAVVTFYWAYRLFKEISLSPLAAQHFEVDELIKVKSRFLEEAIMIRGCEDEIQRAYDSDKISETGLLVTEAIFKELEQDKDAEKIVWEGLPTENQKELSVLQDNIANKLPLKG